MSDPDVVPSRLYKYFHPDVIEHVLDARTLRFTRARDFNDPFELFPTMDAYLRPLIRALLLEHAKADHLERVRAVLNEHFPELDRGLGLMRHIEKQLEDEHSEIVSQLENQISYAINRMSSAERRSFLSRERTRLNEAFGVLSLTAKPDSILMWSHYADSHKGFVLEFDTTDGFFDQKIFPADPLRCIRKVQYEDKRPARAVFEPRYWLRSNQTAELDLQEYMAGVLLLTKSTDWTYEEEWRMVIPLAHARKVKDKDIHVLDLPPSCILRVIIGSAMSEDDLKRIFKILEHPHFLHVEVRRAVCDTQRFRVVLHDDGSIAEKKLLEDIDEFPNDGIQQRIDRLQVSGPRYYDAQAALVDKGWIAIPPYDRSERKKKTLELTESGRARLTERRKAKLEWEDSRKSDTDRLVEKILAGPPERAGAVVIKHSLEKMRRDPERFERQSVQPEVLEHLAKLGSDDEDVRWQAAKALRKVGDANIVEYLASILSWRQYEELAWIHDPRQRSNVTREEIDEIESNAPYVYWLLRERELWGSEELTRLATYALAGIAARVTAEEATDALIDALDEDDGDTQYCAAEALGHIASSRALPELKRLAKNVDEDTSFGKVADAARVAIRRINEAQKRGKARK